MESCSWERDELVPPVVPSGLNASSSSSSYSSSSSGSAVSSPIRGVLRASSFRSWARLHGAHAQANPRDGFFSNGGRTQFMWYVEWQTAHSTESGLGQVLLAGAYALDGRYTY